MKYLIHKLIVPTLIPLVVIAPAVVFGGFPDGMSRPLPPPSPLTAPNPSNDTERELCGSWVADFVHDGRQGYYHLQFFGVASGIFQNAKLEEPLSDRSFAFEDGSAWRGSWKAEPDGDVAFVLTVNGKPARCIWKAGRNALQLGSHTFYRNPYPEP